MAAVEQLDTRSRAGDVAARAVEAFARMPLATTPVCIPTGPMMTCLMALTMRCPAWWRVCVPTDSSSGGLKSSSKDVAGAGATFISPGWLTALQRNWGDAASAVRR